MSTVLPVICISFVFLYARRGGSLTCKCFDSVGPDWVTNISHTDSVAVDYQDEEYVLFGKALKFAGIYGKEIRVIGTNRETLTTAKATLLQ